MKLRFSNPVFSDPTLVSATIFWEHEGHYYPGAFWIDNVNVLLGWWLGALLHLADGQKNDAFLFMEGSYTLALSRTGGDNIEVIGHHSDFRCVVSLSTLANEILQALHDLHAMAISEANTKIGWDGFLRVERELKRKLSLPSS